MTLVWLRDSEYPAKKDTTTSKIKKSPILLLSDSQFNHLSESLKNH